MPSNAADVKIIICPPRAISLHFRACSHSLRLRAVCCLLASWSCSRVIEYQTAPWCFVSSSHSVGEQVGEAMCISTGCVWEIVPNERPGGWDVQSEQDKVGGTGLRTENPDVIGCCRKLAIFCASTIVLSITLLTNECLDFQNNLTRPTAEDSGRSSPWCTLDFR